MIDPKDIEILNTFKRGKWITLAADIFGVLLLFYLYYVNKNDIYLYLGLLLIVVGFVFVYIMNRAEVKYLETIKRNNADT